MSIDLRSDTVTRPTPAMLDAMVGAQLGDDVLGDDPTVHRLQARVAELLGAEAALFTPSGTMANLLAVRSQCEAGDEIIIHSGGHIVNYETAGFAAIAGVSSRTIESPDGLFEPRDVERLMRPVESHFARSRMVVLENTHNTGGGTVWPMDRLAAVCARAAELGLVRHLDGARLWNACVASGHAPAEFARHFDTVSVCFSKGLGAPVGSALAGPRETIERAHRLRKMLGGSMRQAGLLAAAALHAIEHHFERLRDDHANARLLAEAAAASAGLRCDAGRVRTNIVYFDVDLPGGADGFVRRLADAGVRMLALGGGRVRAVTHLGVDRAGAERAAEAIGRCAAELAG